MKTACQWKSNWLQTREHFIDWWKGSGLVVAFNKAPPAEPPHEETTGPGEAISEKQTYCDPLWRARHNHHTLAHKTFPADNLPIADTNIGPGSLALMIGSEPLFSSNTVWYKPSIKNVDNPESLPPFRFDPENKWWRIHESTLKECSKRAAGKYLVGCPDLVENIDILSALRDPQSLLFDLVERPDWVEEKVMEINRVYFDAYDRIYDIIKQPDGGSAFCAFSLWGPGKTAKLQCDASAMFSPAMFERFVVPALSQQCCRLDFSVYHLDGTQCLPHLDQLLGIEGLNAVEWTPQAGIEGGGNRRWYDLYRRILDSGKSVQAVGVKPEEVEPLLKATGGRGMYIQIAAGGENQPKELMKRAQKYRKRYGTL